MLQARGRLINLLERNVEEVINRQHLERLLRSGRKLRVKHGIDPTGEKIHLGRAVVLWKLREWQGLGHKIVLVIGDFTARIGDPSDKLAKRPFLSSRQIKENLKSYLPQISSILDLKKTEVRYNSEWLGKLGFEEISELAEIFSVQQMLARRSFKDRLQKQEEISLRELLYPLMQGYDSVVVQADLEIGGSDQLFNLLAGRKIQEHYGQAPQDVMVLEMLPGLDGRKMSTSWGNVINITDSPDEQFGKIMSMRDQMIIHYFKLATDLSFEEIKRLEKQLKSGQNPKPIKEKLAYEVVKRYHRAKPARLAQAKFDQLFQEKAVPKNLPLLDLKKKKISALDLVLTSGLMRSKSEARRLIEQSGLKVGAETVNNPTAVCKLKSGAIVKIGKRHFFRVR